MDFIRLLVAGLLSFLGLLACATIAVKLLPENTPPLLFGLTMAAVLVVFSLVMSVVFNLSRRSPPQGPTVAELDGQGLVTSTDYKAQRAFAVQEFEDEGLHYFVELSDGTVLYLNGQYLYHYNLDAASSENRPSVGFPNKEFAVCRHRTEGFVLDLICRGEPLKPEVTAPAFEANRFGAGQIPSDGEIIRDRSYDSIKADCLAAAQT
ncbi:MAG TPA: hypothetical protein VMZ27_17430 [Candidatus Saccharimonadales bacterium]|nr:hypothetical protein [Candidatus Saccharimonadales bacterium]